MMRAFGAIPMLSITLLAGGCNAASPRNAQAGLSVLYGTWSSDKVPVSGHGYYEGISTHQYNADGTFQAEAAFTVPDSGCHVELHYAGKYSGDTSAIQVRPTGGDIAVSACKDASQNAALRPYNADELTKASSTLKWAVNNGVLSLHHNDGMDRTFRRQKDTLASLYGTWVTDNVAVSQHGQYKGTATHTFNEDGTYRWKAKFTDPKSGCKGDLHYAGRFTGNAKLLRAKATEGDVTITGCSDAARNAAKRPFGKAELAAASDSIAWNVTGRTLTLAHADGLERRYARR